MKKKFVFVGQIISDVSISKDGERSYRTVRLNEERLEDILAPYISNGVGYHRCTARVTIEIEEMGKEFCEVGTDEIPTPQEGLHDDLP